MNRLGAVPLALLWALAPLIAALIVRRVDPKTRYP